MERPGLGPDSGQLKQRGKAVGGVLRGLFFGNKERRDVGAIKGSSGTQKGKNSKEKAGRDAQ